MQLLAAFSLRNRALIALVTIVAAAFGVLATGSLKQELIPSVQFPQLAVISTYTGASPPIVDERVSRPLEQAVRGIAGVEDTSTQSSTGSSTVNVSFSYGTDLDAAEQKIGAAINRVRAGLPDGVDPQVVSANLDDFPVLSVSVTGDLDQQELARRARDSVVPKLEKLDGVRAASLTGEPDARITVTPKDALADHRLQDTVISDTLRANGVLVPAGSLTEGDLTRAIQIGTELGSTADIGALPLAGVTQQQWNATDPKHAISRPPRIGDVATVALDRDPVSTIALVNGRPALTIAVTKLPDANTVDVSRDVRAALPGLRDTLGAGGAFTVVFDQAPFIEQSIESLLQEGGLGLLFAVAVILLFLLSLRTTLVTAISIPTSVLITLIGMQAAQYSLNILTLGAVTIAIGRVVDDSIVVTENIARHFREDFPGIATRADRRRVPPEDRRRSVLAAVREVAGAVTASTATTVAVFLPLAFVQETTGELFRPFALTVAIALVSSLLVSLTIVPVLAYWFLLPGRRRGASRNRPPLLQRAYRPVLAGTLRHPWLTLVGAVAVLAGTFALVPSLQTNYLGSSGQNTFTVTQSLPDGTSLDQQTVRARATTTTLRDTTGVRTVAASVGTSGSAARDAFLGGQGTQVTYSVTTDPDLDQDALQQRVRSRLGGRRGEYEIASNQGPGSSSDIEIDLTAGDAGALQTGADRLVDRMRRVDEVAQVTSNLSASRQYLAVDVKSREAAEAGFTEAALAQLVARQTQPTSIGDVTIDDDSLTVYLDQQDPPKTLAQLRDLTIPTRTGERRLTDLADVRTATAPASITTTDGARSATVTVTPSGQDTGAATMAVQRAVSEVDLPAGVSATLGGVSSDQTTAFQQLFLALLAAILIVYTIMVATFRSLRQPLLLLVSVPFAATGAILLQLASGIPLGVASIIGLIMLVGIVVTNAIVLIDLVRQYRESGSSVRDAVLDGATRRLRPILMTALATVFALTPMASGLTGKSGFISQPLAIVVIGGLVSSTLLTLVVLPTFYYLVEGRRERRDERRARRQAKRDAVVRRPPEPPRGRASRRGRQLRRT